MQAEVGQPCVCSSHPRVRPSGKEGLRLGDSGRQDKSVGEIYVGPIQGGKFAVVMFARDKDATLTLEETDLHVLMGNNGAGQTGARAGGRFGITRLIVITGR